MLSELASFIEKKPKTVVGIIIIITIIFSSAIPSLKTGTSTKDFTPDNEMVRASDRIDDYFGANTEPVMIFLSNNDITDSSSIKEQYLMAEKIKKIDGVDSVVGISTFVASICGMEYQKDLMNCSNKEIKNAYEDLMKERETIKADDGEDAKYGFADIRNFEMIGDDRNINITIGVKNLNLPKFTSVEWFVSFKNKIDPAKLNLTYIISARLPAWSIGNGIKNNMANRSQQAEQLETYIWIGKEKFVDFQLNASSFLDKSNNEVKLTIPRSELSKYGIAPSFGNASLPAKLYDIEAGSRIAMIPSFSFSSSLMENFIKMIEKSYILNAIFNRIISRMNISISEIQMMLQTRQSISLNDANRIWKNIDSVEIKNEFLIKQPFMEDMRNSALMFLSFDGNRARATLMIAGINGSLGTNAAKDVSKKIVETASNFDNFNVEATGSSVISYQIDELTGKSNKIILPSIFIAIIIILFINFRKPSYVAISLGGLTIAIIWLFGTMALLGIKFNTLAIALIPLIMGLGVDYSVHIFHNYLTEIRRGANVKDAIVISIKDVGLALILATITTAVSFLSFLSASIPSLRDFGILSAIGIAYTFTVAITLEAAMRYLMDKNKEIKIKKSKSKFSAGKIMERLSGMLCKNPIKVLIVIGIITAGMGMAAIHVTTSFSLEEFMPKESPAIKAMEKLSNYFPSASQDQEYILIEGNVATLEAIRGIKETMDKIGDDTFIAKLPDGSIKADSIYKIIENAIKENESIKSRFHIGKDGLPATNEDVVALYNYLYNNKKYAMDVKYVLHKNGNRYDATVVRVYTTLTTLENSNEKMERLYKDLKGDISNYGNARAIVTGSMVLIYTIMKSLTSSQLSSTIVCIVIAGIVIIIAYRKPLLGAFTMLPVITSSVWIMGTIYLAGYSLNVMTVMVTSLTIGLGITYAIHVVERFRMVADKTGDILKAVEEAVANTGGAVLMAALTTVAGFIVLVASPMPPEQQFGFITATTIIYSFLTTVLAIPPLLLLWGKWRKKKKGYIISP